MFQTLWRSIISTKIRFTGVTCSNTVVCTSFITVIHLAICYASNDIQPYLITNAVAKNFSN